MTMTRLQGPRVGASKQVATIARKRNVVRIGKTDYALDCLDDLDAVTELIVRGGVQSGLSRGTAELAHLEPTSRGAEVCPHFGVVWPAARALGEYLYLHYAAQMPQLEVLELGCGLALPSMVARRCGAKRVVATDRHPLAQELLVHNLALNQLSGVEFERLDWRHLASGGHSSVDTSVESPVSRGRYDLVIGSDLLYEAWQPGFLAPLLAKNLKLGGRAIIADPCRKYIDAFVNLIEASHLVWNLAAIINIEHGQFPVGVLVLDISRAASTE